eukprot:714302-Rhodomonas_salina.2
MGKTSAFFFCFSHPSKTAASDVLFHKPCFVFGIAVQGLFSAPDSAVQRCCFPTLISGFKASSSNDFSAYRSERKAAVLIPYADNEVLLSDLVAAERISVPDIA